MIDLARSTGRYMQELRRVRILTREEEAVLARRVQAGDVEARNLLVEGYLRFVAHVAKRYTGSGVDYADLISVGNLGLLRAARTFDPDRGFKFGTYAIWWIKQAIMLELDRQGRPIRFPNGTRQAASMVARLDLEEGANDQSAPSVAELVDATGLRRNMAAASLLFLQNPVRFEGPTESDDEWDLNDVLPADGPDSDAGVEKFLERRLAESFLATLSPRNQLIFRLRFGVGIGDGMTLEEIGVVVGLTRERVRQIVDEYIQKAAAFPASWGLSAGEKEMRHCANQV